MFMLLRLYVEISGFSDRYSLPQNWRQMCENVTCADPEKGQGSGTPWKITKFLSKIGLDPLENHKATKPAFNVGLSLARQETPFKWHFNGGLLLVLFGVIWILSPPLKN